MLWLIHHSWLDLILLPQSSCPVYFTQCNQFLIAFLLINSLNSSYFCPFSFFMMQNTTCTWNLGIFNKSFPLTAKQLISQIPIFFFHTAFLTLHSSLKSFLLSWRRRFLTHFSLLFLKEEILTHVSLLFLKEEIFWLTFPFYFLSLNPLSSSFF